MYTGVLWQIGNSLDRRSWLPGTLSKVGGSTPLTVILLGPAHATPMQPKEKGDTHAHANIDTYFEGNIACL